MFEVLTSRQQILEARAAMEARDASALPSGLSNLLRRFRLSTAIPVGDHLKSWDVWKTLQFIEQRLGKDARILDLGAYASEVPVSLHKMGFTNVAGVDLNPGLAKMPFASAGIDYRIGNFLQSPFEDGVFDAITAISVIEHGYEPDRLFPEVARLLKPGGLFLASTDYWPQKIDTSAHPIFNMSWMIFSSDDIHALLRVAAAHGLMPVGPLDLSATEAVIHYSERQYTFGWMALQKAG